MAEKLYSIKVTIHKFVSVRFSSVGKRAPLKTDNKNRVMGSDGDICDVFAWFGLLLSQERN